MNKPWFDPQTHVLLLDEYVTEMASYQQAVADEVITDEELTAQAHKVTALLQELEDALTPETKELATRALCELAVLSALQRKRLDAVR